MGTILISWISKGRHVMVIDCGHSVSLWVNGEKQIISNRKEADLEEMTSRWVQELYEKEI